MARLLALSSKLEIAGETDQAGEESFFFRLELLSCSYE